MSQSQVHFELIAARAKIMAAETSPWSSDVLSAVAEIRKSCDEISRTAQRNQGGDR